MNIQPLNGPAPSRVPASAPPTARQSSPDSGASPADVAQAKDASNLTPAATPEAKKTPEDRAELDKAVKDISEFVKTVNNSLQFSIDDELGRTVVKVIDTGTKEVIRQIPSDEMLSIAKALGSIKGLLVQQKA